ncbi:hypothetical protein SERLA73DRAFT_38714, partial [Serpula lacrymans var. lacrymans S7.3]
FTDYKVQGRTLHEVIVDLARCFSLQSACVMLSHVKELADVIILQVFPKSKVTGQLAHNFRSKFQRLSDL